MKDGQLVGHVTPIRRAMAPQAVNFQKRGLAGPRKRRADHPAPSVNLSTMEACRIERLPIGRFCAVLTVRVHVADACHVPCCCPSTHNEKFALKCGL